MNWGKILTNALSIGVALKSISDIDDWINEKIDEINNDDTYSLALVETAYEVAKMDGDAWNYLLQHLNVKLMNNDRAKFFYQYCNYVVNLENNQIKSLLQYNINESINMLAHNIPNMELYEAAAYYGVLKAYSEKDFKAQTLLRGYNRLLSS